MATTILKIGKELAGELTGLVLAEIVEDEVWQEPMNERFKADSKRLPNGGYKNVTIRTLGGTEVTLRIKYLATKKCKHLGMRRRWRQRGRDGTGVYPVLVTWGSRMAAHLTSCRRSPDRSWQAAASRRPGTTSAGWASRWTSRRSGG